MCGTLTPYQVSASGIEPDELTSVLPHSGASRAPLLSTDHNLPPSGIPEQQNPYESFNAYTVPSQAPPPPPSPPQSGFKFGLLIGIIIVLVLALISGSVFAFFSLGGTNILQKPALTPTATVAQTTITSTATIAQTTVTSTATIAQTTITPTPQDIYNSVTSGSPVLDDPLNKNSANNWEESTGDYSCIFTGGAYHTSTQLKNTAVACSASSTNFSNFAYQVEMTIVKGAFGGIFFRCDKAKMKYYEFDIGRDGRYNLRLSVDDTGKYDQLLRSGSSPFIKTGLNQSNRIAIVASGSNIYLYVNKQYIASATDSAYRSGQIGVFGSGDTATSMEVAFSNAQVWKV
jgi:hypothetical protein